MALNTELIETARVCTSLASLVAFARGYHVAPVCWLPERTRRMKEQEPVRYVDIAWQAAWAYWIQDFKLKATMNWREEHDNSGSMKGIDLTGYVEELRKRTR